MLTMRFYLFFLIILSGFLAISAIPHNYSSSQFSKESPNLSLSEVSEKQSSPFTKGMYAALQKKLQPREALASMELKVFADTMPGVNLDNGKKIRLRKVKVETPWGSYPLAKPAKLLGNPPKNLDVTLVDSIGNNRQLYLPSWFSERLRQYLLFGAPSKPFDCSSFVHHMLGVQHDFANFDPHDWIVREVSQEPVYPGAVVAIGLSSSFHRKKITHFGLYLGEGLYISKFGVFGSLVVTTLDEMKKAFGGNHVFHLKPRKSPSLKMAAVTTRLVSSS